MSKYFVLSFLGIVLYKVCFSCINVIKSFLFLRKERLNFKDSDIPYEPSVLIVIPVLFEKKIICETLDYFLNLDYKNFKIIISGSFKENIISDNSNKYQTTIDIVDKYVIDNEIKDKIYTYTYNQTNGKRSNQINSCINFYINNFGLPEIIGIYDVDSRPEKNTLKHVAKKYYDGYRCIQQPLHYRFQSDFGKRNFCISNAIYQGSWNLTKEIPNILNYQKFCKKSNFNRSYPRSLYLNGHGQFVSLELYNEINGVPEEVITDGIQIGYRLSLIREPITTISSFCSDDVPSNISSTVEQHKRWFAGNIQYRQAYIWAKNYVEYQLSWFPFIENIFLNIIWASRMPLLLFFITYLLFNIDRFYFEFFVLIICISIYTLVIPVITNYIQNNNYIKINFFSWVLLPFVSGIKSVGPILFIIDFIFLGKNISIKKLKKVNR